MKNNYQPHTILFQSQSQARAKAKARARAKEKMSEFQNTLTQKYLKSILDYDKNTGIFTNKVYRGSTAQKGTTAGCVNADGYIVIRIKNKLYLAHRLAWLYETGSFPKQFIDHKNMIKDDNSIKNLSDVSNSINNKNSKMFSHNTSGFNGVSFSKSANKWHAYIKINYKRTNLGLFKDIKDAIACRKAANIKYGFSKTHGLKIKQE